MKSIRGACLAVAICVACSSAVLSSELSGELQAELSKSVQNVQSDGVGSPGKISDFAAGEFLGEPIGDLDTWEAPLEIQKKYPYYQAGFDDDNRPIWIMEFGHWDVRKIVERGGDDLKNFDKYIRQAAYRAIKSISARSTPERPVNDAIFISDSDGLAVNQVAHVPTVTYLAKQARKYTPLFEKHIFIGFVLNNNFVAETLTNLLKPIYGRVLEKVEIYGTNPAKYIPRLLRHIPKDQLPEWYGGSKSFKPVQIFG